jgi:hypothetical protein
MLEPDPRAVLKMPERAWPKDAIGNDIRKGQLCAFNSKDPLICRVADVVQAGVMHGPDDKPIALQGSVTFVIQCIGNSKSHITCLATLD